VLEEGIGEREVQRRIGGEDSSQGNGQSEGVFSRENTLEGRSSRSITIGSSTRGEGQPHQASTPVSPTPPDPITNSLQPAAAFLAEAARQLQDVRLTADYRKRLRQAVDNVRHQLDIVEKSL